MAADAEHERRPQLVEMGFGTLRSNRQSQDVVSTPIELGDRTVPTSPREEEEVFATPMELGQRTPLMSQVGPEEESAVGTHRRDISDLSQEDSTGGAHRRDISDVSQ